MSSLLDTWPDQLPTTVSIDPFPVPTSSRRRRVVGVDVWVQRAGPAPGRDGAETDGTEADGAEELRRDLVAALCPSVATLTDLAIHTVDDGVVRARVRLLARDEGAHVTDAAVADLLGRVAGVAGWTLVRKLEEFDGIPAHPPA